MNILQTEKTNNKDDKSKNLQHNGEEDGLEQEFGFRPFDVEW
jgi:hypothetical protein